MSITDPSAAANEPASISAPYVQLFQKTHQKIVLLERIEEQFGQLLAKRQELQEELRELQSQINEEFDTRLRLAAAGGHGSDHGVAKTLAVTIGDAVKRSSSHGNGNGSSARFAAQAIEADER